MMLSPTPLWKQAAELIDQLWNVVQVVTTESV